jgi:uncharacterized phage protein (TIGR02218 family)
MSIVEKELTTIAFCWRVERRDGVTIGFTSHDRDIETEGLLYRAAPGILPSAIGLSAGFEVDRLDVRGALTSDAITAEDLAAGRWDAAAVAIFIVDWEEPDAPPIAIASGELGDVTVGSAGLEAELRSAAAQLDRPVVEQTSPECRARLGDRRCRVDMAGRAAVTRIVAVPGEQAVEVASAPAGDAASHGRLRWLSGPNAGLDHAITRSVGSVLELRDPPHFPAAVGDLVEITEGCDKSLATCSARFANAANFRGEPHLPGADLLTRYAAG